MALSRINHNLPAINAGRNLGTSGAALSRSLERLSSGLRINRAADDAAGLTISEKMRGQINGLNQAVSNAQDGISFIQTAEGAMDEIHNILQRMRVLSVQSASDVLTNEDRDAIQTEVNNLTSEVDRIVSTTQFNTKVLLDGSSGVAVTSNNAQLQNLTATADTQAGTLVFAGGPGTFTTASTAIRSAIGAVLTWSSASSITINNQTFSFLSGITTASAVDSMNTQTAQTGVIATVNAAGRIEFTTTTQGSTAKIDITAVSGQLTAAFTVGTVYGTNANVQFSAGATTAISAFKAEGSRITVLTGTMEGLEFDVNATGLPVTAGATVLTVGANHSLNLQVGANAGQTISVGISQLNTTGLGLPANLDVTSYGAATVAINLLDTAISTVSQQRSNLGALQNRLEHTITNLGVSSENLTSSESRIRDADIAYETMQFTRNQILVQAGTAILAQANQAPASMLALLGR